MIAKLRAKHTKRVLFEYKIDICNNSSSITINMFKLLFPRTATVDLNKCMDKKVILHTCNSLCIP